MGARKGKALRKHQTELVGELLPKLALDLAKPIDPAALFGARFAKRGSRSALAAASI